MSHVLPDCRQNKTDNIWRDPSEGAERERSGNRINLFTCKLVDGVGLDQNNQANEDTWGLRSIRNLHAVLSIQQAIPIRLCNYFTVKGHEKGLFKENPTD